MKNETANRELQQEFPNVVIRASAGTGKTFALSNRYLRLLASGTECHTILATTFTKKGAGEILDRIIGRLADAALDSKRAEQLAQQLSWNVSQERAGQVLHQLLRSLHRLEVGTLDSFFSRIAKVFSLELGLPPNWDIVEEQQMRRLYDAAISQVLQSESAMELLNLMGKGEVARRIATVLQDAVEQVYRFYRESGNEPWNRIPRTQTFLTDERLERILGEMEAVVIDKKQLSEHWVKVLDAVRNQDWETFIKYKSFQNFLDGNLKFGQAKLPENVIDCYRKIHPQCQAYVEDMVIKQNVATQQLLEKFDTCLQQAQSDTGKLRFEDVTNRLQSFVQQWNAERCSFRLDQQIQHVLLDEFQDTSLAQWRVVRPFAVTVTAKREGLRSFFCVGDLKQAIYGWRGGIAEIFDLVSDELENLTTETLTQSYRSAPPVIDFVNQVFLNISNYRCNDEVIETAIGKWAQWFNPHSTALPDLAGYVTIEKSHHETDHTGDESVRDRSANERIDRKTIERVQQLVKKLPTDKSIGVIVRTNDQVSRLIAELQSVGIHASEEGGSALTDSAAVDLVLSVMTLADHPGDSLARFHLSHSPLAQVLGLVPETVENQDENADRAIKSAAAVRSRILLEGYGAVVEDLARQLVPYSTQRELTRLQQLVQVAYANSNQPDLWELRPKRFADFVRDDVRVTDPSGSQVRVMTIHKAKGLEFDVVVYPIPQRSGSWSGSIPSVVVGREKPAAPINFVTRYLGKDLRKLLSPQVQQIFEEDVQREIREAMCVLYVALTRAAHAIHIIVTSNAKPDHKSAAGLLLATVCPQADQSEGLLYEAGDPNWFQKNQGEADEDDGDDADIAPFYLPANVKLKSRPVSLHVRSGRGKFQKRPSSLDGGEQISLNSVMPTIVGESQLQRELLRSCFNLVQWLDQSLPNTQQLEAHLREQFPNSNPLAAISQFYEVIKRDDIRKLLSLKSYQSLHLAQFTLADSLGLEANRLEVQNGRRFTILTDDGLLDGAIDRLVLVYEGDRLIGADLIDFKSDLLPSQSMQQTIEHYAPQLTAYRAAVAEFARLPLTQISTRIIFLKTGQVLNYSVVEVEVDNAMRLAKRPVQAKEKPGQGDTKSSDLNPFKTPAAKTTTDSTKQKRNPQHKNPSDRQQRLWDD